MKRPPVVASARPQAVPVRWRGEVSGVLIGAAQIARRIREMSVDIERDFKGRELVVVSLLNGTVMFLADLMRHLSLPLRLDFMGVSSYGAGTESGELVFTKEMRLDVRGLEVAGAVSEEVRAVTLIQGSLEVFLQVRLCLRESRFQQRLGSFRNVRA